jgi:predicted transcriptional regulator
MEFTFGIITNGSCDNYIQEIIKSIEKNEIPIYEIIIVGNTRIESTKNIQTFVFDEGMKENWITRKKNIIVEQAKYENIVLLHDYVKINDGWYKGFLKFGSNYDWCITPICNLNGNRFRDYTLFPHKVDFLNLHYSPVDIDNYFNNACLLPYDFVNNEKTNKYMYISGAYYIIKKNIASKHVLDETLVHYGGEDVEYSKRLHENGIIIKCNQWSSVSFMKEKESTYWENLINDEKLEKFINYCNK